MRHDDDASAVLGGEAAQQPSDVVAMARVQVGRGLVSENDARVVGESSGDRHPLLLATRQLIGPEGKPVTKTDTPEQAGCAIGGAVAGDTSEVGRQLDILLCVERAEQVEVLEDEPEVRRT